MQFLSIHRQVVPAHFTYPKEMEDGPRPAVLLLHGMNGIWGKYEDWALDYLFSRAEVDTTRVALMGGSMGGFYGTLVGGLEDRFKCVVLTVTGAWPGGATDDPQLRFGHTLNFAPCFTAPVFMVNATGDGRESGEELFRHIPEPKEQIWFEHDHYMPPREFNKEILEYLHGQLD